MNSLSNRIYAFYLAHFDELPLDKKMHFASRLYIWRGDSQCRKQLDALAAEMLPTGRIEDTLLSIAEGKLLTFGNGSLATQQLRKPYFERYPELRRAAGLLYWGHLLDTVYGTGSRPELHRLLAPARLSTLYQALLHDLEGVAMLSTYAVNFMYLYQCYYRDTAETPDLHYFLEIVQTGLYDFRDNRHLQLAVYLLTHSIIGESMFYTRAIPFSHQGAYIKLAEMIETLIRRYGSDLTLDTKLEFLTCCLLLNYETNLRPTILAGVEHSLSENQQYIIDPMTEYTSFEKSEHRNLLYLLNTLPRKQLERTKKLAN